MAMRRKAKPAAGFAAMASRFDRLDARFDAMGARFDAMDARFESMDSRFESIDGRFDSLQTEMRAGFNRIGVELDKRPTRSELDVRFTTVDEKFDRVFTALDRATGKLHDNTQSHLMFGAMLGDHRRDLAAHEQRITALESRVPPRTP